MKYQLLRYQDPRGNVPLNRWFRSLKERRIIARITNRLNRAAEGHFGDHHYLRGGIWEMRIHEGPGYRVYYAVEHRTIVLLLTGGDKSSQDTDITKALDYWNDYQSR